MKRIIIVVGIVAVALIAAMIFFWGRGGLSSAGTQSGASNNGNESSDIIAGAPAGLVVPPGNTIQIGTTHGIVTVNNFYHSVVGYEDEFLILSNSADYVITYDTSLSLFYLSFSAPGNRTEGEAALTALLGVDNTNACKLGVGESWSGAPASATLSFCPTGQ